MSTCLAGFWPAHMLHAPTRSWLDKADDDSLGLCRVVHLGWLRHLTNPAVLGEDVLARAEAWDFVASVLADARFGWIDESQDVDDWFSTHAARTDHSHKLWTDDYLAAVALAGGHSFATLDTKVTKRYPKLEVINPAAQ
ncbi:PIN domain-containing protein [Nocardioides hungaricus]